MLPQPLIDAYDKSRDFSAKGFHSGCYAPFVSLYFNTLGEVIACCKNETFVLGNIAAEGLDAIWNGGRIGQLRKALTQYNFGAGCGQCEWQLKSGNFSGAYTQIFEEFKVDSPAPQWPQMMEFTISNTCNFECIMCFGELSSSIRGHREGLPPLRRVYDERFFADLPKFLPHLKRAKFFGGEPFLATENFRIWEMMIEQKLGTPCHVTTNGSIWNDRVRRVLDHLPCSISVSLDGANAKTFESIRVNGNFDEVMQNTRRFADYTRSRGTTFSITFCLMRQNWQEFGDVLLLADGFDCDVWVNTVINPTECSLYTLPTKELLDIVDQMEVSLAKLRSQLARNRAAVANEIAAVCGLHTILTKEQLDVADEMEANLSKLSSQLVKNRAAFANEIAALRSHAKNKLSEDVEKLKEERREDRRSVEGTGGDHVTPAWDLVGAGKFEDALAEVRKTQETNPRYWHALVLIAHVYRRMGNLEAAEQQIEKCIKLTTRRSEPYAERAWLRISQDRIADGIADAERALELANKGDQTEVAALHVLGVLRTSQREAKRALEVFERAIVIKPDNPFIRVSAGWAHLADGDSTKALAEADAALALSPGLPDATALRDRALGLQPSLRPGD